MTSVQTDTVQRLNGTYEIDKSGVIRYFFSAFETDAAIAQMVGRDFYDELQLIKNGDELREKVKAFLSAPTSTDSFNFICQYPKFAQRIIVLLAKIREKNFDAQEDLIIIDLKPDYTA